MFEFVLMESLRNHHEITYFHSIRVALLSHSIGYKSGYSEKVCNDLFRAGLLHDVGKLFIPSKILKLRRALTPKEYERIKTHVHLGVDILKRFDEGKSVIKAVEGHHEREDGRGYPNGGTSHNDLSKIIAVCDVYDSMSVDRDYRKGIPKDEVLLSMRKGEVGALSLKFIEMLGEIVQDTSYEVEFKKAVGLY